MLKECLEHNANGTHLDGVAGFIHEDVKALLELLALGLGVDGQRLR